MSTVPRDTPAAARTAISSSDTALPSIVAGASTGAGVLFSSPLLSRICCERDASWRCAGALVKPWRCPSSWLTKKLDNLNRIVDGAKLGVHLLPCRDGQRYDKGGYSALWIHSKVRGRKVFPLQQVHLAHLVVASAVALFHQAQRGDGPKQGPWAASGG